mgnify:FL=1
MSNKLSSGRNRAIQSTSDYVYSTIREAILTKQIPAGTRLVEAKTSRDLNVSITPVREAFSRLAGQGLLTVFPYKGTYVTIMSRKTVNDIFYIRKHLEAMAAERGFARLTAEDIAYYEELCQKSDRSYDRDDLYESIHCDILFHEHMFTISGSVLLEIWNTIKYRIECIQSYTKPVMNARMSVRHKDMLEALRLRDQERYVLALMEHLSSSQSSMVFPEEENIRYT